jgi:hypothetical protein
MDPLEMEIPMEYVEFPSGDLKRELVHWCKANLGTCYHFEETEADKWKFVTLDVEEMALFKLKWSRQTKTAGFPPP